MPNVKISALPNVTSSSYTDNDLFVLVNYTLPSGTTSNTTLSALTEYIWSGYTGTTSGNCISSLCVSGPIKTEKDVEIKSVKAGTGRGDFPSNTGFGARMLENNISGIENTVMGEDVLYSNTTGSRNSALGRYALKNNTIGDDNIAIGCNSMLNNVNGGSNVSIGNDSLTNNSFGSYNVSLGEDSMFTNTSGNDNVSIGVQSLYSNNTGISNVSVGNYSLNANTFGDSNTSIGYQSLQGNTTGILNVSIGFNSLASNTIGDSNIAIGNNAGSINSTGSSNIFIGGDCGVGNLTNSIAIGGIVSQSNSVVLGSGQYVGINTSAPTSLLNLLGTVGYNQFRMETQYTPTNSSDPNGSFGDMAWDDSYIYIKTSTGWKRTGLSTF
jgi:hypothetical protein